MEGIGNALEFDFVFEEADLLLNHHHQGPEMHSIQQIETPENTSTVVNYDLTSPSGSSNQAAATTTVITMNHNQDHESSDEKNVAATSAIRSSAELPDLPPLLHIPNVDSSPTFNNPEILNFSSPLIIDIQPQFDPPGDLMAVINEGFGASAEQDHDYEREYGQLANNYSQDNNATRVVELPQDDRCRYNYKNYSNKSFNSSARVAEHVVANKDAAAPTLLPPSFNPPLVGLPAPQTYPPTLEYGDELICSRGGTNNWSSCGPNPATKASSNPNQMLMQSFPSSQSSNQHMNAWDTTPLSYFSNPFPSPPLHPYPPLPTDQMVQDGVAQQPFHQETNQANQMINNYSFQQPNNNNRAPDYNTLENVPQFDNMPPCTQSMSQLMNQPGTNSQMVQNMTNNNFGDNNQQHFSSGLYPNSVPQNNYVTMPVGPVGEQNTSSFINQQQQQQQFNFAAAPPQLMNNIPAHRPPTTPASYWNQPNQVMMGATNNLMMDPAAQSTDFVPPQGPSFRPQQVPNQQPQQVNQVPQMPNMYDPKSQYPIQQPGFSVPPIRPQVPYQYQINQAPVSRSVYDPQPSKSLLPELSSNAWTATPHLSYSFDQQLNENRPTNDSMLPGSSMPSRIQPLNSDTQPNQNQTMPNMVPPQLSNSVQLEKPFMDSSGNFGVEQLKQVPLSTPNVSNNPNNITMNGTSTVLSRPSDPVKQMEKAQNQITMPNNVTESQICCSMMPTTSIPSNTQQQASVKHKEVRSVSTKGAVHLQRDTSERSESSSGHPRLTKEELDELIKAASRARHLRATAPPYPNYILNSLTERERKDQNTGASVPTQSKPSSTNNKEHGTSKRRRGKSRRRPAGDSSAPSKRSRRVAPNRQEKTSTATETAQETVFNAENKITSGPNSIRRVKNAVYDPSFEGMGLPIDPHLRMFTAQNNKPN